MRMSIQDEELVTGAAQGLGVRIGWSGRFIVYPSGEQFVSVEMISADGARFHIRLRPYDLIDAESVIACTNEIRDQIQTGLGRQ